MLGKGPRRFQNLAKLYNSVRTYETERIIILLLLLGCKGDWRERFWEIFVPGQENPFTETCINSLMQSRDICDLKEAMRWQQGQTEIWWTRAEELRSALEQQQTAMAELERRGREADTLIEQL